MNFTNENITFYDFILRAKIFLYFSVYLSSSLFSKIVGFFIGKKGLRSSLDKALSAWSWS